MPAHSVSIQTTVQSPSEWVKRRARATEATSKLLTELAFDSRIRRLGDEGKTLADLQIAGGR